LQELRKHEVHGTLAAPSKVTLREWFDQWFEGLDVRPSTRRIYKNTTSAVLHEVGSVRLDKLTPLLLITTFTKLARDGMGARQLQLGHGYLRGCLDRAVELGLLAANPMAKVKRPKWEPQQRLYWTVEEAARFIAHCETSSVRWAPLFAVLATCGLRISEALGLTWQDVNFEGRRLTLRQSLVWIDGEWSVGPLKTSSAYRTISMPSVAVAALDRLGSDRGADESVFVSIHGKPPRHDQLHKPLAKLCAEAGVTKLNVHGLRHVAAALGYHATGDALAVQKRLGHSSVSTTMRIYAYLLRDDTSVAAAVDGLLSRPTEGS
jgi:integrase